MYSFTWYKSATRNFAIGEIPIFSPTQFKLIKTRISTKKYLIKFPPYQPFQYKKQSSNFIHFSFIRTTLKSSSYCKFRLLRHSSPFNNLAIRVLTLSFSILKQSTNIPKFGCRVFVISLSTRCQFSKLFVVRGKPFLMRQKTDQKDILKTDFSFFYPKKVFSKYNLNSFNVFPNLFSSIFWIIYL
jgi:hypothetical protein